MEAPRLSHAILDAESRNAKARKIAMLSGMTAPNPGMRMLEVGCGSGFIASYFSKLGFGPSGTFATDINDERQVSEGYSFRKVDDTRLPFPDEHFDLIVTNHVIEHVGGLAEQRRHLDEIHRCLKPDGILYFAVPNKWRFFEAHYKLPLLSWLPAPIADRYIRLRGAKHRYDCRPLSRGEAETLLSEAGFEAEDKTIDAIRVVGDLEGNVGAYRIANNIPDFIFRSTRGIVPTLIFVARKQR
ncbi:class I SAM-dependent methyltransferase [Mesorhizobium sp.]|uniref:class I SAM-dependent methyltransferase n=1 Tax=Mesorhizobium sp. TaxID=1871066 RepID=UPI000FE51DBA|nr:class I SAM-dependent methyltransferase [Mesorhizobium sp.]RWM09222.1 MAG: class I SAM-dependent methyltransferase [Mesorhizobium sp.]